jgi:hypothetical protein
MGVLGNARAPEWQVAEVQGQRTEPSAKVQNLYVPYVLFHMYLLFFHLRTAYRKTTGSVRRFTIHTETPASSRLHFRFSIFAFPLPYLRPSAARSIPSAPLTSRNPPPARVAFLAGRSSVTADK